MRKTENSNVVVRPSELKPLQCNVLLLCQTQEKRICDVSSFFRMFLKTLIMLSGIFQIVQMFASFRSRRFPKLRISTIFRRAQKNTSKISRKSIENRMTKRMGFYKKRSVVCVPTLPFSDDAEKNSPYICFGICFQYFTNFKNTVSIILLFS